MPVNEPHGPVTRPGALIDRLAAGEARAGCTFAGQGPSPLAELADLLVERPALQPLVGAATEHLVELASTPAMAATGRFPHGLDVAAWIADPDGAPPAEHLRTSAVSHPLILLAQVLRWQALVDDGLAAALATGGSLVGLTGHSQGLYAALLVAEAPGAPVDEERLCRYLTLVVVQGACAAGAGTGAMAAVAGVERPRLEQLLAEVNATLAPWAAVVVALENAPGRLVVSGPAPSLARLRARIEAVAAQEQRDRAAGVRGGAPLRATWDPLGVDVAFHAPSQAGPLAELRAWVAEAAPLPDLPGLAVPVLSPADGSDLRRATDPIDAVLRSELVEPVRWPAAVRALVARGAGWLLDVGPGVELSRLTAAAVRGTGTRVVALASPDGRRTTFTPGAAPPGPDLRYADDAPALVRGPDGRVHVDTRFTRATGRPPVVLAGMTPTTVDAGIVAAAANAGYLAELAGGGQVTPEVFWRRLDELGERLAPGREVAFNALLLDPYLWSLHLGRDRLVVRGRRDGAPLCGVTVSGGIPDLDEGVALLDELAAAGLALNAFKPGTADQVRRVLAIAEAAPQHTVFLHLEGGLAGGHHSWEDLDELLLATYHEVRLRPNVVLCAGGGVGTPARAAELLTGTWAVAHDRPPMPVDAVLVGTAAMACAEATTSPAVKAALVAAPGAPGWAAAGRPAGGVRSGRSSLGADLHLLDNGAARVAALLDEVAGDAERIAARRHEIIEALAGTAKPYFGDLAAMTYGDVLARFAERCATGGHGPYDDGAWGDRTWRDRALALYRRFAGRLAAVDEGEVEAPVAEPADLDDPAAALARFVDAHPAAPTTLLHPADVAFCLEVFDRVGKPVPFVPVIDAEVRRWYGTDALWQAHDPRHDADGVLVIPGPASVAGIERVDEPVAELLARFEAAAVDQLVAAGAVPVDRGRLADAGLAPAPVAGVVAGRRGVLAAFVAEASVVEPSGGRGWRARPNPLWAHVRGGDHVEADIDDDGVLRRLTISAHGGAGERVVLRTVDGDDRFAAPVELGLTDQRLTDQRLDPLVELVVQVPGLHGGRDERVQRWVARGPVGTGPFVAVDPPVGAAPSSACDRPGVTGVVGRPITAPWALPAAQVAAYRATTGATHGGVPLDLAFTLAWPALQRLLGDDELVADLPSVVHHRHRVEPGEAWPPRPDEQGSAHVVLERWVEGEDGAELQIAATVDSDRGPLAVVEVGLVARRPGRRRSWVERWSRRLEASLELPTGAEVGLLAEQPFLRWLTPDGAASLHPGDMVVLSAVVGLAHDREGHARARADGVLRRAGTVVAEVVLDEQRLVAGPVPGPVAAGHPVVALAELLGTAPRDAQPRPRVALGVVEDHAPSSMVPFALAGGDANPLHRSVLAARSVGLDEPIVHGAWTAARAGAAVVEVAGGGDPDRLRRWQVDLLAPVLRGEPLSFELARTGVEAGADRVEVVVTGERGAVARASALVDPPRTALVFPGQGVQRPGLDVGGRDRSAAARSAWQRVEAAARHRLGLPLAAVLRDDLHEVLLADGRVLRHPAGVLHLTQVTQVALVALAAAQVAELREAGVLPEAGCSDGVVACGHSVGELGALGALGVLPLEVAVELAFRRGEVMQAQVPRDRDGSSPFRLAAVDPSRAGLCHEGLVGLVAEVAEATGELAEVVNLNAEGRQYVVAGTVSALGALERRLLATAPAGARVLTVVPGIDVPFHSSVLAPGVAAFAAVLDDLLPPVDHRALVGCYVPNLVAEPFAVDAAFVTTVRRALTDPGLAARLAPEEVAGIDVDELARRLLLVLLAQQIAAPVRWIETQAVLVGAPERGGLGVGRIVEVGPATAPVLLQLARTSAAATTPGWSEVALLHVEVDRAEVLREAEPAAEPEAVAEGGPPEPAAGSPEPDAGAPVAAGPPGRAGQPVEVESLDVELGAATALRVLLALQARVRLDQVRPDESIDQLFDGVSSRRNQALVDLGREFGLSGIEGAAGVPIDELAAEVGGRAGRYRFPGPYLREALAPGVSRTLGPAGLSRQDALDHLARTWGLGPDLGERVLVGLALDVRPGPSARGGDLGRSAGASPVSPSEARVVLDRAAELVAGDLGLELVPAATAPDGDGARLDGVAATELRGELARAVVGSAHVLARTLGLPVDDADGLPDPGAAADAHRLAALDDALGPERAVELAPRFEPERRVSFTEPWAPARWDLVTLYHDALDRRRPAPELAAEAQRLAAHAGEELGSAGCGPGLAHTARWFRARADRTGRGDVAALMARVAAGGPAAVSPPVGQAAVSPPVDHAGSADRAEPVDGVRPDPLPVRLLAPADRSAELAALLEGLGERAPDRLGEVALVTGASPGSIAFEAVRHLLRGGARVVVATSTETPARRRAYRELYRTAASPGAELHVVPANLASFADVDALVAWTERPTGGAPRHRPGPLRPTVVLPFAAVPTVGHLGDAGPAAEVALRVQLLGVERLVGRLAEAADRAGARRPFAVVLPLSPNHGDLGGDLPYGESKAGLEVLLRRHRSEPGWAGQVVPVALRIGWVRGTGLMAGNDALAPRAEEQLGIRTFSVAEAGSIVAALCDPVVRTWAPSIEVSATGGLDEVPRLRDALTPLGVELVEQAAAERRRARLDADLAERSGAVDPRERRLVPALPRPATDQAATSPLSSVTWPVLDLAPADLVVVVGCGEVGPGGTGATRFELELADDLPAAAVTELAWMCGLVRFERQGYRAGWVDVATGEPVAEHELAARYRAEVRARVGVRPFVDDGIVNPEGVSVLTTVHLDDDLTFAVGTEDEARTFVALDPDRTRVRPRPDGRWDVTRRAGSTIRVPRRVPLPRGVAGQFPTGFDPARWSVPPDLVATVDRIAVVNLIATAEAFAQAGLSPEELLGHVHPAQVGNSQGGGMGGWASLRRLLLDRVLDEQRQADRLQESLINVVAAHVVQSYVGSYGPMVHPVAACATAAVSVEEAVGKIAGGQALAMVAGGYDDLTPEGIFGFADMGATADTARAEAMGLAPEELSRAGDVRRLGFVEAQGGGTVLLVRGDVALELGLPVRAVVAYAGSFGDGIHSSIPAPGMGLLACARGGPASPLGAGLARLGLTADDVGVVSKHDTATEANDPNEADLHHRIQEALGRTPGNPLLVVSQKSVTGHGKGGAAAWQLAGLVEVLERGVVPGNRHLECVDPALASAWHLALGDRNIALSDHEPVRAALLTSLGFGHVSALVALAHPAAFLATVPEDRRAAYLAASTARRARGERDRLGALAGEPAFVRRAGRRVGGGDAADQRAHEAAALLDPGARVGPDGQFGRPGGSRP